MGIEEFSKVIEANCPNAIQKRDFEHYGTKGRKIAISANTFLCKFLSASTSDSDTAEPLRGLFDHAVGIIESEILPVYVFNGDLHESVEERQGPPEAHGDSRNLQDLDKSHKIDLLHIENAKKLLELMGIPIVQAPGSAEAQCAALVKTNKVFAVATESMDALLYGAKVMISDFTVTNSNQKSIRELNLDKTLDGLKLSMDQFIDLSILIGCVDCPKISEMREKTAPALIKVHGSIQEVLNQINKGNVKYTVPNEFNYKHFQQVYKNPIVDEAVKIDWRMPIGEDRIISHLCLDMDEESILAGVKKLKVARTNWQPRIDSYYSDNRRKDSDDGSVARKKPKLEQSKAREGEDDSEVSHNKN